MKGRVWILLGLIVAYLFSFTNVVSAEDNVLKEVQATVVKEGEKSPGNIKLYGDYTIEFNFEHALNGYKIWVCEEDDCDDKTPTIASSQIFYGPDNISKKLTEYMSVEEGEEKVYIIKAQGTFRNSKTSYTANIVKLEYKVELKKVDGKIFYDAFVEESQSALKVIKKWVIPGLYILFALTIIVKGILLGIDIVHLADQPDLRREKIRAFIYFFVAMIAVTIVTTSVGYITGLFD